MKELGFSSVVLNKRANAGDIVARSKYFNYSLVGDSKVSRLSRTARNQKDFKISALNSWRQTSTDKNEILDYSALCPSYFDYPSTQSSQVYLQAVKNNVCLFSWEYILFFIRNGIKENPKLNLESLWDFSHSFHSKNKRLIDNQNHFYNNFVKNNSSNFVPFDDILKKQAKIIRFRANDEISYLNKLPHNVEKAVKILTKPFTVKNRHKIKYIKRHLRKVEKEK